MAVPGASSVVVIDADEDSGFTASVDSKFTVFLLSWFGLAFFQSCVFVFLIYAHLYMYVAVNNECHVKMISKVVLHVFFFDCDLRTKKKDIN